MKFSLRSASIPAFLLALMLAWPGFAAAAGPDKTAPGFASIDALVQHEVDADSITGAVIMVGHQGKVVHERAFGARVLSPKRQPMTLDTVFDLASMTKVVATTPSVMRLVQFGQLRLNEPVAHFLPEFGANGKQSITVRQLLTHYS